MLRIIPADRRAGGVRPRRARERPCRRAGRPAPAASGRALDPARVPSPGRGSPRARRRHAAAGAGDGARQRRPEHRSRWGSVAWQGCPSSRSGPSFRYWVTERFGLQAHLGFGGEEDFRSSTTWGTCDSSRRSSSRSVTSATMPSTSARMPVAGSALMRTDIGDVPTRTCGRPASAASSSGSAAPRGSR